jgi:hypothetical protein
MTFLKLVAVKPPAEITTMTDWADFLSDPRTIRAIFGEAPSLDQVELFSILLEPRGPTATLTVHLPEEEFPADPPRKWREAGFNRVVLRITCFSVRALELHGLETIPVFDLKIGREGDLLRVHGATDEMVVDIRSDFLDVHSDSVSAYLHVEGWGWQSEDA